MATRRAILGAGLEGMSRSLEDYYSREHQDDLMSKRQAEDDLRGGSNAKSLEATKSFDDIVKELLKNNPTTASNYSKVHVDPRDAVGAVAGAISKAKSVDESLTDEDVKNLYQSHPGGDMTPDYLVSQTNTPQGDNLPSRNFTTKANPNLRSVLEEGAARRDMLQNESNKPNQVVYGMNPDGSKNALPVNPRTMAPGGITTEVSAQQQGKNEATKSLAGPLSPGVVRAEVGKAGQVAGAQAAAAEPYKDPTMMFDDQGDGTGLKYNPKTKSYDTVAMPPGLGKTAPKALTQGEVENVASMNAAEIEGVKVLSELHKTGLDKSNDMADPRWAKFVVGTLKMAPGDYQKADIQQRAAYVKAALTRALMGARPSQYVAKIIQEHIPDGAMTGQQLVHVMSNVMEQVGEKRSELGNVSGRKIPGPTTGGYAGYLQAIQGEQDPADAALAKLKARKAGLQPMTPAVSHKVGG
jgi:hypothetical protein